jgi:hypothetical protein
VGSVWSFRTRPCTEFSPPDTGRYAALKVIEATPRLIAVVLLDGVWNAAPDLEAVARRDLPLRRAERFDEGKLVRGEEFHHKAVEGAGGRSPNSASLASSACFPSPRRRRSSPSCAAID